MSLVIEKITTSFSRAEHDAHMTEMFSIVTKVMKMSIVTTIMLAVG